MSRDLLLVGSVGLSNAEEVLRKAAALMGPSLTRIPDGETGYARSVWIQCQTPFFIGNPALEMVEPEPDRPGQYRPARIPSGGIYSHTRSGSYLGRARLRPGVSASELRFDDLGYAGWASDSYRTFARLKAEGVLHSATRFQVCIPSPRATLGLRVLPEALPDVAPAYDTALDTEVKRLADSIPASELAIQWDCTEPTTWDRLDSTARAAAIETMARIGNFVPEGVELGYHLCYGDFEHQHGRQPTDTSEMVEIANRLRGLVGRSIDWVHMPVPRDRDDKAYFAPLANLELPSQTKLFLGLVHYTDGLDGTRTRMKAANDAVADFGIATECGFGRRPSSQDIECLMKLHAKAAQL